MSTYFPVAICRWGQFLNFSTITQGVLIEEVVREARCMRHEMQNGHGGFWLPLSGFAILIEALENEDFLDLGDVFFDWVAELKLPLFQELKRGNDSD